MDSVFLVRVSPDCLMAFIDSRDAYLHIPIGGGGNCQEFLRLAVEPGKASFSFRSSPLSDPFPPAILSRSRRCDLAFQ